VGAGQQLRNFFPVNSDNDSYALERFDFGRGANSIVFGNGSLGGVSSSTTKRARTDRAFQDVKLTAGSFSMMRATIDVNQPINDKVALRVAGVAQHGLGWRQKEFEKRKGVFATTTLRPFQNTVVRVEAEAINREINQPINNLQDQLSGWNGSTTFATPAALNGASAAQITALQAQGVARRGAQGGGFRPRDFHRILEQLDSQLVGNRAGRRMVVIPDRMSRNKAFRKSDDAGAIGPRFANQAAGFLRRTSAVEKHRRRLHGGNFDDRVLISWHDQSAQDKPSPTSTFSDLSSMPEALACNNKSWEKS
jgi:outer membrane receptor protein involved in Fe transport